MYQYENIISEVKLNGKKGRYACTQDAQEVWKNKEKRKQASGNFGTMIPRALFNEINEFLEENDITKVRLIKEGYEALKKKKENGTLTTDLP